MSKPIIEVNDLRVIYNKGKSNEVRSLDKVSVRIYPEEYVIFFGPSGCGKSTLLYSISGLQAPTEGDVSVLGKNLTKMNKKELVNLHQVGIGMIFQAFYLISSLSIVDNVCLPKVFRGEAPNKRKEDGIKLLHRFSIVEQANKFPSQLSGGQKQRVSIARALVNNPQIILADEPVGNLDSESAKNVLQILRELNEVDKKTVILVTHNAEHLSFADRVIYLKDGKIIKEEVNREKRPAGFQEEMAKLADSKSLVNMEELSTDLRLLMRTFKNLSAQQIQALLVPFKANQLMSHILSEFTDEQISTAGGFLKELLFENIDMETFQRSLDMDYEKGGAGWNKQRVKTFATRVGSIMEQAKIIGQLDEREAAKKVTTYLVELFKLEEIKGELRERFEEIIRRRIKNELDRDALQKELDISWVRGGIGLHKHKAERIAREMEIIMLTKYSV